MSKKKRIVKKAPTKKVEAKEAEKPETKEAEKPETKEAEKAPENKKPSKAPSKKKVEKVKADLKAKDSAKGVPAPKAIPVKVGGVVNPLVEQRRLKRAMAVALFDLEKDEEKLAKLIVASGIPFKQVASKDDVEGADLCNKVEWSGKSYAGWAVVNGKDYKAAHPDKVKACVEFAKALVKCQ